MTNPKAEEGSSSRKQSVDGQAERDREPPKREQVVFLIYYFVTTLSFTIVLPTSLRLSIKLGGDAVFSGLLIGLMPAMSAVLAIPNSYVLVKYEMKGFLLVSLVFFIAGNLVYGLANLANSRMMLLIGRMQMGVLWAGPLSASVYAARGFGVHKRTLFMSRMGLAFISGYILGPLMGFVLEKFCQGFKINDVVVDMNTIPAWFIIILALHTQVEEKCFTSFNFSNKIGTFRFVNIEFFFTEF